MFTHSSGSHKYNQVNQVEQFSDKRLNVRTDAMTITSILMIDELVTIVVDDTLSKLLDSNGFPVGRNAFPVCHRQTWLRFKLGLGVREVVHYK